jgi:hypothetical protein
MLCFPPCNAIVVVAIIIVVVVTIIIIIATELLFPLPTPIALRL